MFFEGLPQVLLAIPFSHGWNLVPALDLTLGLQDVCHPPLANPNPQLEKAEGLRQLSLSARLRRPGLG